MGEPFEVSQADRYATRALAASIVESVREDAEMPLPMDIAGRFGSGRDGYYDTDVETFAMQMAQEVVALQNEVEMLREYAVTPMQRAADLDQAVAEETAELRAQLAAMAAARDEACDLAKKKRRWRTQVGPSNYEVVNIGPDRTDEIRIAELRKVGAK